MVGNNRYDGFCAELAKKIANIVHFDYVLREVKDGKFGAIDNGSWNGMVGELIREVSRSDWMVANNSNKKTKRALYQPTVTRNQPYTCNHS